MMNHHEGGGFLDNIAHFRLWLYYWHPALKQNQNRRYPGQCEQQSWICQGLARVDEGVISVAKRAEELKAEGYVIAGACLQFIDPHAVRRHNVVQLWDYDSLLREGLELDKKLSENNVNRKQAQGTSEASGTAKSKQRASGS